MTTDQQGMALARNFAAHRRRGKGAKKRGKKKRGLLRGNVEEIIPYGVKKST